MRTCWPSSRDSTPDRAALGGTRTGLRGARRRAGAFASDGLSRGRRRRVETTVCGRIRWSPGPRKATSPPSACISRCAICLGGIHAISCHFPANDCFAASTRRRWMSVRGRDGPVEARSARVPASGSTAATRASNTNVRDQSEAPCAGLGEERALTNVRFVECHRMEVDASHRSNFQCHDGLGFEERLQSRKAELSAGTRLFETAERRKRIVLHPVDGHASCLEPTCHCLCSR
jgi:hypothetical protein